MSVACTVLANSSVNVVLPVLAQELAISAAAAAWVTHVQLLAGAIGLLPAAALGDRYGHGRVFRAALLVFCLASLGCGAAAWTPWPLQALLTARFVQGLGAAGVMAVSMALLRAIHPLHALGRFIGLNAMAVAASHAAGPAIGGSLGSWLSWSAVVSVIALPAAISLTLAWRAMPNGTPRRERPFNALSATLQAATIGGLLLAVTHLGHAWSPPLLGACALLAAAFIVHERRHGYPLLPLDLLRQPLFAIAFASASACFVAQMAALLAVPFLLHGQGLDARQVGWVMTPWPVAVMFTAPLAGALSDRWPAAWLMVGGLATAGAALAALAMLAGSAPTGALGACAAAAGFGFALFTGPNARSLATSAPAARAGAVGGMHAMSRQVGQLLGSGMAGALLAVGVAGPRLALLAAAAAAWLAALASLWRPRRSA